MELSRSSCRLCLLETEFNVSLFGNYSRRKNMIDKILVCLNITIKDSDLLNTICYKCADNVERYYDFINVVKKSQQKIVKNEQKMESSSKHFAIASYVREQVYDADFTLHSFLVPEEKEQKPSSPFFSYISPHSVLIKHSDDHLWKSPKPHQEMEIRKDKIKKPHKRIRSQQNSRDLFESQDTDEANPKSLDWKLTPDDNIIQRIRSKLFGTPNL